MSGSNTNHGNFSFNTYGGAQSGCQTGRNT